MPAQTPSPAQGLSDDEARARLARDGPNRLPQAARRSLWRIALDVATQPMILLLLATTLAYAVLGNATDAIGLLVSVLLVGVIAVYQMQRTERVLESLRDLSSPRARVVRSGRVQRIASLGLVRGDLLLLAEGDRLACDAVLVRAHSLLLDESLLTGESAPVLKSALPEPALPPADEHRVYAGTLVVQGDGAAIVSATATATALGRIGASLAQIAPRASRVQAELKRVVRWVALAAVVTCLAAAALYAAERGSWIDGLLVGLTLAMSLIPEEFAVVWTVLMALGAWRLAQRRVLTRQPQAIEALGTASVLCVDKTGTLTVNRMELLALATPEGSVGLAAGEPASATFAPLLDAAARASVDDGIEPMDRAIGRLREHSCRAGLPPATLVQRDGVTAAHLYVAQWWRVGDGAGDGLVAVKGAPEAVQRLCDLDAAAAAAAMQAAGSMAQQGLRVLAVAQARWDATQPPPPVLPRLDWIGLIGFLDPLRDDVPDAMAQCRAAGIRVVMITGDAPLTALAISRQARLHDPHGPDHPQDLQEAPDGPTPMTPANVAAEVLSGAEVAALDDAALEARMASASICARVAPEQKLRIVRALQRRGEVVAMTGDGVNDAPALRAADIGVAMGERGTDVAREAAVLVLQDDSFASLVAAVRLGRRIFVNLKKSVGYLLAVHVPIVGVALMPLLAGGPQLLLPLHVVFLELLIDPACSLVFEAEPEPPDTMTQPPRPAHVGLLSWATLWQALAIGGAGLLAVAALQVGARWAGWDDAWCRAAALGSVIATNVAMLVWFRVGTRSLRRHAPNLASAWLLAGLAAACGLVLGLTPLTRQFGLPVDAALQGIGLALMAGAAIAALGLQRARRAT
jgi:P-type Ca2+ transporter type 2C